MRRGRTSAPSFVFGQSKQRPARQASYHFDQSRGCRPAPSSVICGRGSSTNTQARTQASKAKQQSQTGGSEPANVFFAACLGGEEARHQPRSQAALLQLQLQVQEVSQAGHQQDAALMATTTASYSSSRAAAAAHLLLVALLLAAGWGWATAANDTQRFRPGDELRRYRRVQALLERLNKPALRTIQARACTSPPPARRASSLRALFAMTALTVTSLPWLSACLSAEPRRRPHRLRCGAPAAGLRPPEAARAEATGGPAGEAQGTPPPPPPPQQ